MQYQVPQNIAMEDRIIGSLTLIQFVIVVVGGGAAFFFLNQTWMPSFLSKGLAGFTAFTTVLIAMGKFNDQPMYRFFRYIVAFVVTPKIRVWHKGQGEVNLIKPSHHAVQNKNQRVVKKVTKADLARLAVVLDSRGRSGVVPPTPVTSPVQPPPQTPPTSQK